MSPGLVIGVAAAASALLLVVCTALVVSLRTTRRLRSRMDDLERRVALPSAPPEPASPPTRQRPREDDPEYVITTAGLPCVDRREEAQDGVLQQPPQVDARQFASLAVGESLVRIASLAYGVRRALSPENRNRIGFEVKREIRRSRRQRRRDLKEARRHLRAAQREEDAA